MTTKKQPKSKVPFKKRIPKRKNMHYKVMIVEGLPDPVKTAFKSACAQNGVTMRDVIIDLMKAYVEETRKEGERVAKMSKTPK